MQIKRYHKQGSENDKVSQSGQEDWNHFDKCYGHAGGKQTKPASLEFPFLLSFLSSCALFLLLPASLAPSPSSWSLSSKSLAWLLTAVRERRHVYWWRQARKKMQEAWYSAHSLAEPIQSSKFCTSLCVGTWIWPCTIPPNLNRFTLELKKSLFLENHHTVLKAMYAVWKRQTCRHRGRKDVTFPESVACHFYLKNWKLYMEKEFPIQFKPFAEQNWSSKNMLLASAPHFTHAAPSSLMWTPDAQKSSRWTSWPAGRTGRCWWPGSSWPSIEFCWLGSPTSNFGLS